MPSLQVYGRVKKFVLRHCPSTGKLISIHSILGSPTPPPPPRSSFDCQSRRRGSFSPLCASRIHPVAGREERRGVPSDSRRTHEHARTSTHALRELPSCSASSRGRTPSRRSVGESPASHDASRSPSTSSSARQRAKLDRRFFSRQALTKHHGGAGRPTDEERSGESPVPAGHQQGEILHHCHRAGEVDRGLCV